jgi:guanylate kinase
MSSPVTTLTVPRRGGLVVISGPAGVGKSTVVRKLLTDCPLPMVLSVSATTRRPRPGERDGIEYHFLSAEEFQRRRDAHEFLECKEVFGLGHWYGTLQSEVSAGLNAGKWVILEIDVQGAMSVL